MSAFRHHVSRVSDPYWNNQRIDMDIEDLFEEIGHRIPRRTLKDRENPLEAMTDNEFRC
jgi:hypothetical protein